MAAIPTGDSVGLVVPQSLTLNEPLNLSCGSSLHQCTLVYETYGSLNKNRSNAVLVCHALSGHHHAAGYHSTDDHKPGWWETCIGPGKAIDTNRFFVVSCNNIGGCHGSSGPLSTNPETGEPYGPDFPVVTVKDWVYSQSLLADHLGIDRWAGVAGGSLGGMQALQWAIDFPDRVQHALVIACAPKLSAQNIAFNEIARQAILTDPDYREGNYFRHGVAPEQGLMLARMLGHITYQSDYGMGDKFGRQLKSGDIQAGRDVEFQVESYLHHQGRSFSKSFDANTYVLMTRALDYFDPAAENGNDLVMTLKAANCGFLVVSFSSDWRFSPDRSREIIDALVAAEKNVAGVNIQTHYGHDSFLLAVPRYIDVLGTYMARIFRNLDRSAVPPL